MIAVPALADDQAGLWNGHAGHAWVEAQALLDRLFAPVEAMLVDAVRAVSARHVLDIGCGTGATTRAMAGLPGRRSAGIDISQPMLALAMREAEREDVPARFIRGDAQHYAFEPGSFDLIVSRFGVMFFDDPVQAFTNLRRAARPGAGLCLFAWRGPEENPFMTTAERAAAPFLPTLPARRPDEPGQFGFANPDRIRRILMQSGWEAIEIAPVDFPCAMPEGALERYFTQLGPLGRVLGALDAGTREHVVAAVRAAFEPFVHGDEVRFTAACWNIAARSPA